MSVLKTEALSVHQLSDILKACFNNPAFQDLKVYGEIYSLKLGKFSYLEIGDQGDKETSSPILKVAFSTFYGDDYHLEDLKIGDVVQVEGSLSYYPHGSSVTLWGRQVELLQSQLGKNLLAKRKTLEKLEKLGYLNEERKRPIPAYCHKVAILTAATGAAYQDILKTLHGRFPVDSVLYPITVQGEDAAKSILKALLAAQASDADVILLGRGGGSKSDLSCFDDEKVALAIATSPIPVITAIGHTIDTAIADRVSDKMAITPTEGASLINPSLQDIQERLQAIDEGLTRGLVNALQSQALLLESLKKRLEELSPAHKLSQAEAKREQWVRNLSFSYQTCLARAVNDAQKKEDLLVSAFRKVLAVKDSQRQSFVASLTAYDPSLIVKKGYSLVYSQGKLVRKASDLKSGETITLTYPDGRKDAVVKE
jgi:exodeoxyribonuclease VII large subunit